MAPYILFFTSLTFLFCCTIAALIDGHRKGLLKEHFKSKPITYNHEEGTSQIGVTFYKRDDVYKKKTECKKEHSGGVNRLITPVRQILLAFRFLTKNRFN